MKKVKKLFRHAEKRQFILHTPLIAIVYTLSVYRIITQTDYPFSLIELGISLILLSLLTLVCFWISKIFVKDKIKAAIITTLFLAFGFNAVSLGKLLSEDNILIVLANLLFKGDQFLTSLILLLLILSLLTFIIHKIPSGLFKFNNYLNVLLIYFLIFEIFKLATFEPKRIELNDLINQETNPIVELENSPNIYYLIFDSYTSFNSLKKFWNFENKELKNFLIKNGFYIAEEGRSNYNQTHFTLASTLNMSYLHYDNFNSLTLEHYPNLIRLIKDNSFTKHLKKLGYDLVNYSFFDISNTKKYYRFDVIDEPGFFKNTLFKWIINIDYLAAVLKLRTTLSLRSYELIPEITTAIKNAAASKYEKPFFLYAHFMIPHPPFYFDRGGNLMPHEYSSEVSDMWKYLEQLKYSNKIIIELVDFIMSYSESKPIIIIQGDHGFRALQDKKEQGAESHSILNTFYFPDKDYNLLYSKISSVNTFRVLLNKLCMEDIELLPDKSYFVAKGIGF
jgi:hypothetical protein